MDVSFGDRLPPPPPPLINCKRPTVHVHDRDVRTQIIICKNCLIHQHAGRAVVMEKSRSKFHVLRCDSHRSNAQTCAKYTNLFVPVSVVCGDCDATGANMLYLFSYLFVMFIICSIAPDIFTFQALTLHTRSR